MIIKHERSTHTKTTNNVSYQQRMREHTQFRVHSTVGNTTMTVVLGRKNEGESVGRRNGNLVVSSVLSPSEDAGLMSAMRE